jgi:hypothetical protein
MVMAGIIHRYTPHSMNSRFIQCDHILIVQNITLPYLFQPSLDIFKRLFSIMKANYVGFTTFNHLNCLSSSIQFVMVIESDSMIPLLGVFGFRKKQTRTIHTGRYLILEFNHSLRVKSGIIQLYTTELLPNTKTDKIGSKTLTTCDVIFSSMIIPKGSLTQFLTLRVPVRKNIRSLLAPCPPM